MVRSAMSGAQEALNPVGSAMLYSGHQYGTLQKQGLVKIALSNEEFSKIPSLF